MVNNLLGLGGGILPGAALIGAVMIEKAMARDAFAEANGMIGRAPQCRFCGQASNKLATCRSDRVGHAYRAPYGARLH